MPQLFPGRYAAQIEGPFVVFLIGMRVNNFFALHKWTRVARAMPPMLQELASNKDSGFLNAELALQWRGVTTIQYWRSFEQLHAYAHARNAAHLPAWAEFNRRIGGDGSVGIWHETYTVAPGQYESIYANMPRFGLGAAAELMPANGQLDNARSRIEKGRSGKGQPENS